MYRILIVEDDETISSIMEEKLSKWGYIASKVVDFRDVMAAYTSLKPHLVLLDINLPYYDGFYWCAKIRQMTNVPILFISSRDTDADKIRAISQGGDDYIEKPFSMDLLVAKVQAALRRAYSYSDQTLDVLQYRDIVLDVERLEVFNGESKIELTKNECKILAMLIRNKGRTVSRTRIMKVLWDDESFVDDNTLTVNINRLRKKLEGIGIKDYVKTIRGEGYRLT